MGELEHGYFNLEAYKYLKLLVEEQTMNNNLLKEKLEKLENDLKIEKFNFKSLETKYNELLIKKDNKKQSDTDNPQKTVNTNKNISAADGKKGLGNVGTSNLKTLESEQQKTMCSYININNDITNHENQAKTDNLTKNDETNMINQKDEFKLVTYKNKKPVKKHPKNICYGTGTSSDGESGFCGIEKKLWLYVYRIPRHVTEQNITNYISKKPSFKNLKVEAKELPTRENQNKVFLVTAPFDKKDEMYQPNFWPNGTAVKRFDFNRQSSYNQKNDFL